MISEPLTTFVDEPIVPRKIGICSNKTDVRHYCGRIITNQDIEAVELPQKGRRRQFCCGPCVTALLSPKPEIDLQEKIAQKRTHRNGLNGNGGKPKAQPGRHYW